MDRDDFYNLFTEVTTHPPSYEWWQDEGMLSWLDVVVPNNALFSAVCSHLMKGVRLYISFGGGAIGEGSGIRSGKLNDTFRWAEVCETKDYYWFFALNDDVSDCQLGKLEKKDISCTKRELLEGFIDYCNHYGPKYS